MTNYTNTEAYDHEKEKEEEKKKDDEILQKLFRSKEFELKKDDLHQSRFDLLNNTDIFNDFEIKNKDENGRNIIHRACLEQRLNALQ